MVEPGQEAFVESNGLFERVIVIEEINPPHHPYLTSFPFVWRKVAIRRSPQLPIEVISLRDLRFA